MTVDEAMEEFRKELADVMCACGKCGACVSWLSKVRHLFNKVQGTAYSRGQQDAFNESIQICVKAYYGGKR